MNPVSKDIAAFLNEESSLGLVMGTSLFFSRMPDNPALCVTVFDNPGDPPMLTLQKSTSNYHYASVSVQVRSIDYAEGYALMHNILDFLHALGQLDAVDATAFYGVIKALNEPQVLHWDTKERVIFFINFEVQRKPN